MARCTFWRSSTILVTRSAARTNPICGSTRTWATGRQRPTAASMMRSSGAPTSAGAPSAQTAPPAGPGRGGFGVGMDWAAALELTIATHGGEPYKSRLKELFPQVITPQQMDFRGWTAVRALPYLDAS